MRNIKLLAGVRNVATLAGLDFVFVCVDRRSAKKLIIDFLLEQGTSFIDVGMGLIMHDGQLTGLVRTTTSTATKHDHLVNRISTCDNEEHNEYARNIQIADLNALNAALAAIKWKKLLGFYADDEHEQFSLYTVRANALTNEDDAE